MAGEHAPLCPGVHIRDPPNGLGETRLNVGEFGLPWGSLIPANHSGSTAWRPGLGGVEEGRKEYSFPLHPGRVDCSSQPDLIRGVREVGELNGGVTGALMEPLCMKRWGNLGEEDEEDAVERFLSHGMRELPSELGFGA